MAHRGGAGTNSPASGCREETQLLGRKVIMFRLENRITGLIVEIFAFAILPVTIKSVAAESGDSGSAQYSPVVSEVALRGLSTVGSAEPLGAGRITFNLMPTWYQQNRGYSTALITGSNIFSGTAAFSWGVNSNLDLFASLTGFALSNDPGAANSSGTGAVQAGVLGSLPFPDNAILHMAGQIEIFGDAAPNQINTYRADGYDFLETRAGYNFLGRLLQTIQFGNLADGIKLHLNEAGVVGASNDEATLLLLGAGLEADLGPLVLGAEINSRTQFNTLAFGTDPLWVTPSIDVRTPYNMNIMGGVDVSLSEGRPNNNPPALESYRVFLAVAFSYDLLEGKRKAERAERQKAEREKDALEYSCAQSTERIQALNRKAVEDSVALSAERLKAIAQMDSIQRKAYYDVLAARATAETLAKRIAADSLALNQADSLLAAEKTGRSEAETRLLSTGELSLDAVYFENGDSALSINSKPYLEIIGKMLLKYPKLQIEVAGHTDNVGSLLYNVILSQGRANAVRNYLKEVAPLLGPRMSAHGYGMSMPKADNATQEGRLQNRRVELRVINRDVLPEYSQR